jgi:hypothetical protein
MAAGKGNKHGGRKSRIKNYRKTKHFRLSQKNRNRRQRKQFGE